jgi:hypothetical protein
MPSLVNWCRVGNEIERIFAVSFLDFKSLSCDLAGVENSLIALSNALLIAFSKSDSSNVCNVNFVIILSYLLNNDAKMQGGGASS